MSWDPDRYLTFGEQRFAPFDDLIALVPQRDGQRAVDLGCGTGELTRRLANHIQECTVVGIDSSEEMLERARGKTQPGLTFRRDTIETVEGGWDLIFSNAALHWVEDHERLVPHLMSLLQPGGRLVVQVPSNDDHPSHRLIMEIGREEPFASVLGGWGRTSPVLSVRRYAEILFQSRGGDIVAFDKVYPHVLPNADAVADWTSGTSLLPYRERLPADLYGEFEGRYRSALRCTMPESPLFFGFKRTIFAATAPQ